MTSRLSATARQQTSTADGLYVHVPFCRRKCPYCDFYSITGLKKIPDFCRAVSAEMELVATDRRFDTLYFGGGTPSLLSAKQIGAIIKKARATFILDADAEITLEVNPGTIDGAGLMQMRKAGINRLNIGVQSFDDSNLRFLGRIHTADQARKTIEYGKKAGFDNIGIDIIYGLPHQKLKGLENDLRTAVAFEPEHLSCYLLTIETGTPLFDKAQKGAFAPLTGDQTVTFFLKVVGFLTQNHYEHYEISNFAKRSASNGSLWRSRHNQKYWDMTPYLGFGPAAHSFVSGSRHWNHADLATYLAEIAKGRLPLAGSETLTNKQQQMEVVYLGLRTAAGVRRYIFTKRFGFDLYHRYKATLDEFIEKGYVQKNSSTIKLTPKGMCLHESIAARLV